MAVRRRTSAPSPALAARLKLLVLDVDGTLTDGALYFGASGEQLKVFNVRDGHGVKLMQAAGITVAVISGRKHAAVLKRCRDLGIRHVIQGAADKSLALDSLLARLKLDPSQVACIGDDTPDIPLFTRVAFAVAVADAHPLALAAAHRVTTLAGGRGAVREACDWLLDARSRA
jgi:3-deoxy-D-manno-octulosonate 8-phosphate phosphatase (KDO 8-P phosphatase)